MRNQALITIDSLRYDVFEKANLPFLKSFKYSKAYTHGTYTLPAHESFFIGKLPHTFDDEFDTVARANRKTNGVQLWRLMNPESDGPAGIKLQGKNIIDGFNKLGYHTIGTGAVGWFNTNKPAYLKVINDFKFYKYFGVTSAPQQINFVSNFIKDTNSPYFMFINFGETHHPFKINPKYKKTDYGNTQACFDAQVKCVEYLDGMIKKLVEPLKNIDIIVCADHGECMGESGLWGHSFHHAKVMEVPILKITK